jgi:hypothetical protein
MVPHRQKTIPARKLCSIAFVVVAAGIAGSPGVRAQMPPSLVGQWAGNVVVNRNPMAVNLTIEANADAKLHFGVPRSCSLDAEYSGNIESKHFFSVTNSNGGWCDQLLHETLQAQLAPDTTLALLVPPVSGQGIGEALQLARAGTPGANKIDPSLLGSWEGQVVVAGRPVAVDASVADGGIGDNALQFHYGQPRGCRLVAEYVGLWNQHQYFAFNSSTGGWCDQLLDGSLQAQTGPGGGIAFRASSPDGHVDESGSLRKVSGKADQ